ncbi:hypothetical protein BBI01_11815 [Chryseobacterium artocarpi]|uniref:Lipoprotein n=1 Tax=Chryseobacterium artocarpi TaxID=1414727 RepID=A0A1B8ZG85_9FLAO|nr:hypothetical protein [Chryseobacterium artocarpi]OCA70629.1 hypothetical protein BBI01_11815 [Chryseobacterium artocarpi]
MKKLTIRLLACLSLAFFVECSDSDQLSNQIEISVKNQTEDLVTVKTFNFNKSSRKERAVFLKKCLKDPIGMGMIKFESSKIREYNIKNKSLERLLMKESERKDVYFFEEFFTVLPKENTSNKNIVSKLDGYCYYGDSQISVCSGVIYANTSHGIVNDNCQNYKMGFNLNIMHAYTGYEYGGGGDSSYFLQACAWDMDPYGDSGRAVAAAPVEEVFTL